MQDPTDILSPAGRNLLGLDARNAFERLTVLDKAGNAQARPLLEALKPEQMITAPVKSLHDANALVGALWLWHDWLDDSHQISQKIDTPTGSWWHAIMHRREGDFSNSKHWYSRAAGHTILAAMGPAANSIVNPLPSDKMLLKMTSAGWNPNVFVDLVEEIHDKPDDRRNRAAVQIQQAEWRLLFDHCVRAAAGR